MNLETCSSTINSLEPAHLAIAVLQLAILVHTVPADVAPAHPRRQHASQLRPARPVGCVRPAAAQHVHRRGSRRVLLGAHGGGRRASGGPPPPSPPPPCPAHLRAAISHRRTSARAAPTGMADAPCVGRHSWPFIGGRPEPAEAAQRSDSRDGPAALPGPTSPAPPLTHTRWGLGVPGFCSLISGVCTMCIALHARLTPHGVCGCRLAVLRGLEPDGWGR